LTQYLFKPAGKADVVYGMICFVISILSKDAGLIILEAWTDEVTSNRELLEHQS
jgi:hypothetical protein